jgi:hypothetical protein
MQTTKPSCITVKKQDRIWTVTWNPGIVSTTRLQYLASAMSQNKYIILSIVWNYQNVKVLKKLLHVKKIKEDGFFFFNNSIQNLQLMGPAHWEGGRGICCHYINWDLAGFHHGLALFSLLSFYKKTSIGGVPNTPRGKEDGLLDFCFKKKKSSKNWVSNRKSGLLPLVLRETSRA